VVAQVGGVPGHQRDTTARFDDRSGDGELVDPVQYARLAPPDSRDHGESLFEREAFVHGDPRLVEKIRRFDRSLRREWVIASDRDIEGLEQERFHTHRPRPRRAADQSMCEDQIVIGGEKGEIFLSYVEIAQPYIGPLGTRAGGDQWTENGQARAVERHHRNGSQRIALKKLHRLSGAFERHFHVDRRQRQGAPGVGKRGPPPVPERQRGSRVALQGADLLRHRRRRDVQRRGDGGDAAPVPQLSQCAKLTQFHKFKLKHSTPNSSLVLRDGEPDDGGMPALVHRFHVDLLLLLVAASWGSTYLVAKELVNPESVVALLALRMLLAAALMAAIVAARRNRITAAELRAGVLLGMILAAVFAFETFGIANTSATNAGLIISLTIVFTPILDSAVSGRRLPGRFFLAATIAIGGVALLASNGVFQTPSLGDLLILVAAIIRAIHVTSMFTLTGNKPMDSLHLTTVQLATCAMLFSAVSLFHGDSIPHFITKLDPTRAVLFLYLVLACTVFAFLVQTWAVRRTSPSRVSLLLGTEPIWAAIIGVAIARDHVALAGYVGIALILAGTSWGRSIEQRHRLAPHDSVHSRLSYSGASKSSTSTSTRNVSASGLHSSKPVSCAGSENEPNSSRAMR